MDITKLEAKTRATKGKKVKVLRAKGTVPAVVYGHGVEPVSLEVDYKVFEKILDKVGESSLIDLSIDGKEPVKVLIQDVQHDPIKSLITHVDFRQVKMTEKLETDIEFNLVGEAPAVKELGAILVRSMNIISVRCLPQYLVPAIDIDLSSLKAFGDNVKVKNIKPPEGMEFLANPDDVIVVVNEPISEAELKELEAKPVEDVTAVKVEAEEKKEKADGEAEAESKKE
jgi:large subunit ribosomal protein L25